jgi:oligoendopeptidase F
MSITKSKNIPTREEIPAEFKWNLSDIYPSQEAWEEDFKKLKQTVGRIHEYQGNFLSSAANLTQVFQLKEEIGRLMDKLFVYAKMHKDENNANPTFQALTNRIQSLATEAGSALSFIVPALVELPAEKRVRFMNESPELKIYRHFFDEIERQRQHILSAEEEKILAQSAEVADAAGTIFGMLDNADFKFPVITDENGEEVELTKGRYSKYIESKDRRVRTDAFKALYSTYSKFRNTLGATLDASVKADIFYAKTRHFDSAIQASLDDDNIPLTVYDRLIEVIHQFLPVLHRYLQLRKKILNIPELHMYDLYTPLVPEYQRTIDYQEAKNLVLKGLSPMGPEYIQLVQQGLNNGWIDVYENEGKTGGAYAWGAYDTHPYILANYQDKVHDVFTIAHEMGHALHSYFSNHHQPFIYAGYKIFVAEVASTVNEALLMEYLLANSANDQEKLYLLNQYLEQFRTTVFRQTMFAEFEKTIHHEVENGGALTAEWFSEHYLKLNQDYYGAQTVVDPEIAMEWSRIPHFYSAFYVYKYATGYSAAIALSQQILKNGAVAVPKYLEFLKSGDSDYPLNLLRKAGVDMESPEPVRDALKVFEKLLNQMIELTGVRV